MPRVLPKKARFRPDQLVKAWQSFAVQTADGLDVTVPRLTRLRGDHPAVTAAPWNFVEAEVSDDEMPSELGARPLPEEPKMFEGPTRIRFVPCHTASSLVLIGARQYGVGEEVVVPAGTAQYLVEEGYAEEA
jgi:hypothetical protein